MRPWSRAAISLHEDTIQPAQTAHRTIACVASPVKTVWSEGRIKEMSVLTSSETDLNGEQAKLGKVSGFQIYKTYEMQPLWLN